MKISQLKWNVQTIITTLSKLEKHRDNLFQSPNNFVSEITEIDKCKANLDVAFANLESKSLNKLVAEIKKRKTKRNKKKLKTKKKNEQTISNSIYQQNPSDSISYVSEQPSLNRLEKCKLRCSKKYLASIECLETLHGLKGGGDSCNLKETLNSIKSIWQSTANGINEKMSQNCVEKSWDKVLFGGKSEIEMKSSLEEFLERRFVWDTYLDISNGSHIPVGWVYPKVDARSEWKQFQTNIIN